MTDYFIGAALWAWYEAVQVDVTMEGPVYRGVSSTLGRKAWEMTYPALQPDASLTKKR